MSFEDLALMAGTRPFVPFRIYLTDGSTIDILHPELIMLGRRSAVVGIPKKPEHKHYERHAYIDFLHIMRMERLPPDTPLNGEPATGTAGG